MNITAILLAAGGSKRLGVAKQCLPIDGEPLLHRSARRLLDSRVRQVVAVLGANVQACRTAIDDLPIHQAFNRGWRRGMASSIITGLQAALDVEPDLDAVLLALCDQPMVTSQFIDEIIAAFQHSPDDMVASQYGEVTGVPAVFGKSHFPDLLALEGDRGAQTLLQSANVHRIPFPQGLVDLDTPEQYQRFLRESS